MRNIDRENNIDVNAINYSPIATFKQGDNATLELTLFKNGQEFDITGQTVTLGAYRPNNTVVEQIDGFTINRNLLTIQLKNSVLAVYGLIELELNLEDSEGEMTTSSFFIKVNKKVLGEDNLAASDEFNSLKQLKIDLQNAKRDETTRIENEKIRANNEIKRQEFYENKAKPLAENLKNYDSKITTNTKNIRKNTLDIERAFEVINDGSYLPFEGENITIEHSKVGFTKDMKIEGMTYQNLAKITSLASGNSFENGIITLVANGTWARKVRFDTSLIKANTTYTIIINCISNNINTSENNYAIAFFNRISLEANEVIKFNANEIGLKTLKIISKSDLTGIEWWIEPAATSVSGEWKGTVLILEGDYNQPNKYTPTYFEGIRSIGEKENRINISSVGKNLFNIKDLIIGDIHPATGDIAHDAHSHAISKNFIRVKPNTNYSFNYTEVVSPRWYTIFYYDKNKRFLTYNDTSKTFISPNNCYYIRFKIENSENIKIKDIMLNEGSIIQYEPYKEDKKEILLPFKNGLKGLSSKVKDEIVLKEDGVYIIEKVKKNILNGSSNENWLFHELAPNQIKTVAFNIVNLTDAVINNTIISDKFTFNKPSIFDLNDTECISSGTSGNYKVMIKINRDKLETQDVKGFKKWLQSNPITVYYELAEPIEYKISELTSINLETFKDITHVFSENEIQPKLSFKAPVDIPKTISSLRSKNVNLEHENKELKDEINTKTLKLHDQDVELTNSDLDLDFRIFELEMNIGLPINLNMKGVKNMARSPFEMMRILILNNNYDREDIEYKASRYLQGKRITQAEYNEIISLMDANELVK